MSTQNLRNRKALILITLAVLGLFIVWLTATNDLVAQGDNDHAGHGKHEDHEDHDEDSDHADHEEGEHDDHAGHDKHEDVIKLSDADMKKFGIEIAKASPGKLPADVSLPGEVTVNEDRIAHVTPRVPGVVRQVRKTLGDRVRAGEILATLDSPKMGEAQIAYLDTRELSIWLQLNSMSLKHSAMLPRHRLISPKTTTTSP